MSTKTDNLSDTMPFAIPERQQLAGKQMLALDALSNLTKQFANRPDFHQLLDVLLLTFSGQFSVASCFITVRAPGYNMERPIYVGAGKFKDKVSLELLGSPENDTDYFLKNTKPCRMEDIDTRANDPILKAILSISNLKVFVPLLHGEKVIGILGLGEKVTGEIYSDSELELMLTLTNTITPLLVNSFLFMELSIQSKWYHAILNSVKQGVFVFDKSKKLAEVNEAGFEIMRQFRSESNLEKEILNRTIELVFSDDLFPGWTQRILKSEDCSDDQIIENVMAGNSEIERIFNVRVSTIGNKSSATYDLVVTLDDITEQKENEQRMFNLERYADKGIMAASISHELNNFLGVIVGGVDIAKHALQRERSEDAVSSLDKVKEHIMRMNRFTVGLMDYTKLDTKKEAANLNVVVSDVLTFISVQQDFKHIIITSDLDSALREHELDIDQMAQLLLNMLNNAADAISEAGRKSGTITVATRQNKDTLVLVISDNGNGMKPEIKEQLFKTRLTTKPKGHGYGLVTTGKIISNHQGTVVITSELGSGTTFEISFRMQED